MDKELKAIPRVPSKAPRGNTLEWEIPGEVVVSLLFLGRTGYICLAKVKRKEKRWWQSSWETLKATSPNISQALLKTLELLRERGYYIDADSVEFGEVVGWRE